MVKFNGHSTGIRTGISSRYNDVQLWFLDAEIENENEYTTIGEVLADSTTFTALLNTEAGFDYFFDSLEWIAPVFQSSTAMGVLKVNGDAVQEILVDPNWDILLYSPYGSSWFTTALVPKMTSNTTPSGVAASSSAASGYEAWKAFDQLSDTSASPTSASMSSGWVSYKFTKTALVGKVAIRVGSILGSVIHNFKVQGSNDNSTWTDIYTGEFENIRMVIQNFEFPPKGYYLYYRVNFLDTWGGSSPHWNVDLIQFYGLISE